MKCYIYKIINKVTGEKYVGQTTNFSRRINEHKEKLRANEHKNPKLQSSWNKYGEENFLIEKVQFDLTKEELNKKEIEEIEKENSYYKGFNLTLGGDGGNTRGTLTFEQFCFAYFGNKKYKWLLNRTGRYLGVDGSIISSLVRDHSYDWYRQRALELPEEEKLKYIRDFEEKLDIKNIPPRPKKDKLSKEQIIIFLSIVSTYGRGAEAAITRFFQISKGLKNHLVKGEYQTEVQSFSKLTDLEIEKIATEFFEKENLQQFCTQKIKKNNRIIRPL